MDLRHRNCLSCGDRTPIRRRAARLVAEVVGGRRYGPFPGPYQALREPNAVMSIRMAAHFAGRCAACALPIAPGDDISFSAGAPAGQRARHVICPGTEECRGMADIASAVDELLTVVDLQMRSADEPVTVLPRQQRAHLKPTS